MESKTPYLKLFDLLTNEDMFNLFCSDIGTPKALVEWYFDNSLISLEVLQWT